MTLRAYQIDLSIDPTELPWVFDTENHGISTNGDGYVEINGSLPGGTEVPLRSSHPGVPETITPFQANAVLHIDGHLAMVETLVAQADSLTQIAWHKAQEFRRTSPTIAGIQQQLGWTDAYVDDLFIRGSQIQA